MVQTTAIPTPAGKDLPPVSEQQAWWLKEGKFIQEKGRPGVSMITAGGIIPFLSKEAAEKAGLVWDKGKGGWQGVREISKSQLSTLQGWFPSKTPTIPGKTKMPAGARFDESKMFGTDWQAKQAAAEKWFGGQFKEFGEKAKRAAEERKPYEKWREEGMEKLGKTIEDKPSMVDFMDEKAKDWRVPEAKDYWWDLMEQNATLQTDLINLNTEEKEMMLEAKKSLAPMTFIRGEEALIGQRFDIKRAGKSAQLSANAAQMASVQGYMGEARAWVSNYVNAAVWDYERKVEDLQNWVKMNSTIIGELKNEERMWINSRLDIAKQQLDNARADREIVGNLMIQYPEAHINANMTVSQALESASETAGIRLEEAETKEVKATLREWGIKYPSANIDPTKDSLDDAYKKILPYASRDEQLALQGAMLDLQQKKANILATGRSGRGGGDVEQWEAKQTEDQEINSQIEQMMRGERSLEDVMNWVEGTFPHRLDDVRKYIESLGEVVDKRSYLRMPQAMGGYSFYRDLQPITREQYTGEIGITRKDYPREFEEIYPEIGEERNFWGRAEDWFSNLGGGGGSEGVEGGAG